MYHISVLSTFILRIFGIKNIKYKKNCIFFHLIIINSINHNLQQETVHEYNAVNEKIKKSAKSQENVHKQHCGTS